MGGDVIDKWSHLPTAYQYKFGKKNNQQKTIPHTRELGSVQAGSEGV